MRRLRAIIVLILVTVFVMLLDRPMGSLPALGRLLDPVNGALANAEPVNKDFNLNIHTGALQQPVKVWFDERLVPHVHAANDHDLYYIQGYIHAYFRLWQMDLQTRAAAGRVSEVIGSKALDFDRKQRRKGMVYGAENSLRAMEAEPRTKLMLDAYTAGINHFISSLNYRALPLEYKLMGFTPEPWTNLKSALLLKYMADDLTGYTEDIALTVLRDRYSGDQEEDFKILYPERTDASTPVIPAGTAFPAASLEKLQPPPDSIAFVHLDSTAFEKEPDNEGKGSNNWAVGGSRTQSGAAILCNDPHLGLNLPSLWFEMQLQTPDMNVYGASLPGAPGVVIGFNDHVAWGFTNNYRDVKDFYAIKRSGNGYAFAGKVLPFTDRIEKIGIKGQPDFIDTVKYTIQGPVMYDEHFHGPGGVKIPLAMCWMAHRGTNEMLSVYLLNRSTDYTSFVAAIHHFECPGQNMVYADRQGNIAMWGQGQFVNKWKGQGRYVMNGADSSTLWKELIPMQENPHVLNPAQGFVSSANQSVTDTTYPYWYNGYFYEFRAWRINQVLSQLPKATIKDMMALQNDTYSFLASEVLTILSAYQPLDMTAKEKEYADMLRNWDYKLSPESKAATVFEIWWSMICSGFKVSDKIPDKLSPSSEMIMNYILYKGYNVNYDREFLRNFFRQAIDSVEKIPSDRREWYHVKNTSVRHLAKLPAFSYTDLKIGGWGNTVNAAKGDHGPSWRMIVQMGKEIEAYGVYPGGQSGNPGSKYYATFLDRWVKGDYYRLQFLPNADIQNNSTIKYTWTVQPK